MKFDQPGPPFAMSPAVFLVGDLVKGKELEATHRNTAWSPRESPRRFLTRAP